MNHSGSIDSTIQSEIVPVSNVPTVTQNNLIYMYTLLRNIEKYENYFQNSDIAFLFLQLIGFIKRQ